MLQISANIVWNKLHMRLIQRKSYSFNAYVIQVFAVLVAHVLQTLSCTCLYVLHLASQPFQCMKILKFRKWKARNKTNMCYFFILHRI